MCPLHSITPFSMLDFPGVLSSIFWFSRCNLECRYCYNPELLREGGSISLQEALNFLDSRVGLLDGVVFSGGEATNFAGIAEWAQEVKKRGFKLKLDTNGTNKDALKELLDLRLLDYVAIDFKGLGARFLEITGRDFYVRFLDCLELLLARDTPFEVRTTVHSGLLSSEDIYAMSEALAARGDRGEFYLQHFVGDKGTLKPLGESHRFPLRAEHAGIKLIWR